MMFYGYFTYPLLLPPPFSPYPPTTTSILGLPFFSGLSASPDPSSLRLNLGTVLPSGSSLRLSYSPHSASSPFSLLLCSPSSFFSFHLHLPLLASSSRPSFPFVLKPRLGDFSLRKLSASSSSMSSLDEFAIVDRHVFDIERALSGVELTARSVLPIKGVAAVSFRGGVKVPTEMPTSFAEKRRNPVPMLVMNKISVEYLGRVEERKEDKKKKKKKNKKVEVEEEEEEEEEEKKKKKKKKKKKNGDGVREQLDVS